MPTVTDTLAECNASRYAATPADQTTERRRLAALVVEEHRSRLGALVRRLLPGRPDAWADGEQAAAIGLLTALGRFNPARGAAFWTFAFWYVRQEVQAYRGVGVHWQRDAPRGKRGARMSADDRAAFGRRSRMHQFLEAPDSDDSPVHWIADERTPESLVVAKEQRALADKAIESMTPKEQRLATHGGSPEHYKAAMSKVRTAFLAVSK